MMDKYEFDLFWHALNYRTAQSQHAQGMWIELEACVDRLVRRERQRCAEMCRVSSRQAGAPFDARTREVLDRLADCMSRDLA